MKSERLVQAKNESERHIHLYTRFYVYDTISTSSFLQVELVILASGFAPAAEISASNDGQDASGLAPDAINFVTNQTYC